MTDRPRDVAAALLTPLPTTLGAPTAGETDTHQPWTSSTGATSGGHEPETEDRTKTFIPDGNGVRPIERPSAGSGRPSPRQNDGPLQIGQSFGTRYHIIKLLGVGGMGAVYQAWDAELSVTVAIKVIRPEIAADPVVAAEIARRFKRELVLARQVTHRNVVRIHDLGEIDGVKYITMAYVEGSDLATILKNNAKLPIVRAIRLGRRIVSALVSAHEAGVIHRDLKPANIMVGEDDEPTIMDFGIARSSSRGGRSAMPAGASLGGIAPAPAPISGGTVLGTIIGTVEYMAPEQAKGEGVDQRADIYALGLILYDMLVGGRRSQKAASAVAELQRRMQEAPPAPRTVDPHIPPAIDAIISRCLDPDPAKRFQTSAELDTAFEKLDDNGKPLPIIRRLTRRTMAAAAVLVLLLLAGTFYTTKWLSAPVKENEPVSVVIADFENTTNDTTFDRTLEQTVRRALEGATFISAYDRSRISALGVPSVAKLDEVAARQLAVQQGLRVVLSGSIAPDRNGYDVSIKAVQSITGNVIAVARRWAPNKDQVLDTATRLTATVRKVLGDKTSESAQLFAMKSTSSLQVVSLYAAGAEAQSRAKYDEARQSYLKAVELDPKFGLGYQGLAVMSRNLGRQDDAEKYIKEALRYLDGMTDRERFITRGFYYRVIGDNQQCAKEYLDLLVQYPADAVAHNQRAICLSRLRDMRGAMDEMQQAVNLLPKHVTFQANLALLANLAGKFDEAERVVTAMEQPDTRAVLALAYSQVGRGMLPEAAATYQRLSTMGASGASSASSGLGDLAVFEGRFSDAVRIFEQGAAADLSTKNPDKAAIKFTSIAYAHLLHGQRESAISAADTALANSKAMPVRFLAARIFADTGVTDKARTLAQGLSAEMSAERQAHGKIIEGLIALNAGRPRDAVKILTEANGILDTWFGHYDLGRAYLQAGSFLQADSELDRCVVRRGEALSLMDEGPTYGHFPLVHYYQGRVREELKTARFADSYREYLNIRGATTEDPLLPEVRRRAGK